MCKTITVDGERKGVRGGKCGKPTSNSLPFSIEGLGERTEYVSFFRPSLNRVLFPMFCLLVEGESDFSVLKYY